MERMRPVGDTYKMGVEAALDGDYNYSTEMELWSERERENFTRGYIQTLNKTKNKECV